MSKAMSKRNTESEPADSGKGPPVWRAGRFQWKLDERALVMAILNITPDSFSDGGRHFSPDDMLVSARRFVAEGADILDIGGESTRPGATPVPLEEELARVLPVIEQLGALKETALSIDTCKPAVAAAALKTGADIVNDISGFRDPAMIEACCKSGCGIVVMHMQGTPQTMQKEPSYQDVVSEVREFFDF